VPRLARGRKTHLTPEEIAAEALRQFDADQDPSIRSLAAELGVAPTAIYHHFPSRSAIVDAAIGIVWRQASKEGFRLLEAGDPEDPTELLVVAALATRRAFGSHHQIAPYIAATPGASEQLAANLGLLAGAFEALGLRSEEAARGPASRVRHRGSRRYQLAPVEEQLPPPPEASVQVRAIGPVAPFVMVKVLPDFDIELMT